MSARADRLAHRLIDAFERQCEIEEGKGASSPGHPRQRPAGRTWPCTVPSARGREPGDIPPDSRARAVWQNPGHLTEALLRLLGRRSCKSLGVRYVHSGGRGQVTPLLEG